MGRTHHAWGHELEALWRAAPRPCLLYVSSNSVRSTEPPLAPGGLEKGRWGFDAKVFSSPGTLGHRAICIALSRGVVTSLKDSIRNCIYIQSRLGQSL